MSDDIRRGQAAERILNDDLMQELFTSLEQEYTQQMKSEPAPQGRDLAWHRVKALEDILFRLRRMKDSGTRALASTR